MDTSIQPLLNSSNLMIEDLDTFVNTLTAWHNRQVEVLKQLKNIPDGTEVSFEEGKVDVITGDLRKGFAMGIEVALIELGQLPFVPFTE